MPDKIIAALKGRELARSAVKWESSRSHETSRDRARFDGVPAREPTPRAIAEAGAEVDTSTGNHGRAAELRRGNQCEAPDFSR